MARERVLFWTLWGVIVLLVAIWRFWPDATHLPSAPPPPVSLSRELSHWFIKATTNRAEPGSRLEVALQMKPERSGSAGAKLALEYRLMGASGVLFRGVSSLELPDGGTLATVTLPNPARVSPHSIELYLAR